MPFNWNLFGAANQVSEPIYGDDEDLDAPFVAVDPFRTSVQPRRGRWACPDTNDDDLEGGTTSISQPLSQAPLEECTSFPGGIPASHTVPRDRVPRPPYIPAPGLSIQREKQRPKLRINIPEQHFPTVEKPPYHPSCCVGAPTSCASHRSPSPIHLSSHPRQSSSIVPPSAPAPSARQASIRTPSIRAPFRSGSPSSVDRAASDESRRVSFISPEPLRRTASHAEAASRSAGVHAGYHPATPQLSVAFCKSLPEQGVKAKLRRASVYGERTARASSAFAAFLWRFVPATLYLCVLFRLPALYFSRVARVFENAELCRRDSIRMAAARATQWEKALGSSHASGGSQDRAYGGIRNYGYGYHFHEPQGDMLSFPLLQFKKTWEQFIDNLLQEWKVS